jgi:hypothetical protein
MTGRNMKAKVDNAPPVPAVSKQLACGAQVLLAICGVPHDKYGCKEDDGWGEGDQGCAHHAGLVI